MRHMLTALVLLCLAASARADVSVSVGIAVPGAAIGIHVPAYPRLVRIPGLPVYYGPELSINLFFYDGAYWVFYAGDWYVSTWYDGPWYRVPPHEVPVIILRVPIRYYRVPPPFFYGHPAYAPPPWHKHWGREWEERHRDWKREHRPPPRHAPPPFYQREYPGERYPRELERQRELREEHYRYEPRERVIRERFGPPGERHTPPGREKREGRNRGEGRH